jgi:hypothetical protein
MTIQVSSPLIPCQAATKDISLPLTLGRCCVGRREGVHIFFLLQRSSVIIMKETDGALEIRRPGNIGYQEYSEQIIKFIYKKNH